MSKTDFAKLRREIISEKSDIRKAAFAELKSLTAEVALPILSELLSCKNDDVLADISKAMVAYKDECLPYLVKALASDNWSLRRGASAALAKLGPGH